MEAHRVKEKFAPGRSRRSRPSCTSACSNLERDQVAELMPAANVDADAIEIEEQIHRRVRRSAQTYTTAAGPVERWRCKDRGDEAADGEAREGGAAGKRNGKPFPSAVTAPPTWRPKTEAPGS